LGVKVNIPCLLIIQETNSKGLTLLVSDPTQKFLKINIKINGKYKKEMSIKLPEGKFAGNSITTIS